MSAASAHSPKLPARKRQRSSEGCSILPALAASLAQQPTPAPWSAQDAQRATREDPTLLAYAAEPMEPDLYDIMPPAIGGLFMAPAPPGDLIARLAAALAVPQQICQAQ